MLIFFIIDFFAWVGKYVGLFEAMGEQGKEIEKKGLGNALYVDGIGNIIGGILGASSLAVFVSSVVGIKAGGKTGWTAVFIAALMLLSLFTIPLLGAIPVEATAGILVYVGFLLVPFRDFNLKNKALNKFDITVSLIAALLSFVTYSLDKAILLVFLVYTLKIIFNNPKKSDIVLIITTLLLLAAIITNELM
jgi:AGZA family xanthine/uracil permease-like MFS transporter